MTWRDLLAAHLPAFSVASVSTLMIAGTAVGLRAWHLPPPVILAFALLLSAAAVLAVIRSCPRAWLSADIRWALEIAETLVPRRLRFLLAPRRPSVAAELPGGGTAG
jgi:hypothetical protein